MKQDIMKDIETKIDEIKDKTRANLNPFTTKAFSFISPIEYPIILDIGSGSGEPTLELANQCNGIITAIDIDEKSLSKLRHKVKQAGLENRITVINMSCKKIDFPPELFDIIWTEGAVFPVGFKKALMNWKQFLKHGGYMTINDSTGNLKQKLKTIEICGYNLIHHFTLGNDVWIEKYFNPLLKELKKLHSFYGDVPGISFKIEKEEKEIQNQLKNPRNLTSTFFIMQKAASDISNKLQSET